jgi:hypothetical protein
MFFEYTIEDNGYIFTDGKKKWATIQPKTDRVLKIKHAVSFYNGFQFELKKDSRTKSKNYQILDHQKSLFGMIKTKEDPKIFWLEVLDKKFLNNRYRIQNDGKFLNPKINVYNESGQEIVTIYQKFVWSKMKNYFIVEEKNHDKLLFEDRMFIYTIAFASKQILS